MFPEDFSPIWARFSHYLSLLPVGYSIPRIYQEAAYLYANMQHKEFIDELPIDESVKKSFHSFVIQMDSYKYRRHQPQTFADALKGNAKPVKFR